MSGAGALQIPLLSSTNQAPLGHPSGSKPLVNSTELQDLISGDRLMTRANKLFEIAKLGEEEYNHPTRVIGSAGMLVHVFNCHLNADQVRKVISERCHTFMRRF
jgi:aminopeptidase Y